MRKLIGVVLLALALAGCTSETKTIGCVQSAEGQSVESNFIFNGTKLVKLEQKSSVDIPEAEKENVPTIQKSLEASKAQAETIEGASYEYSLTETNVTVTLTFDVTKLTNEMLIGFGFTDDMKTDGKFDPVKITEMYAGLGVTCTQK